MVVDAIKGQNIPPCINRGSGALGRARSRCAAETTPGMSCVAGRNERDLEVHVRRPPPILMFVAERSYALAALHPWPTRLNATDAASRVSKSIQHRTPSITCSVTMTWP